MKTSGKIPIVFFGSGPVAAESLKLLQSDFAIEAVITKPTTLTQMEQAAPDSPVLAVTNRDELDSLINKHKFHSKLAILIDFGIIVSQKVIDYFQLGIINSHFSLLPEWRGADPISFAILSGQKQTGVSLMLLTAGMDEGPLLAQAPYDIPNDYTTPELTNDLIQLSYESLRHILPEYIQGKLSPAPQEQVTLAATSKPSYSRKLTKNDGVIDWNKSAEQIEREIRAFIDWPKSRTTLANREVIITKAKADLLDSTTAQPGDITAINNHDLVVRCGSGSLRIYKLKPAGKKEMTAAEFIRGYGQNLDPRP